MANKHLQLFQQFIGDIRIISKEVVSDDPRGAPLQLWESQRRFVREVGNALDDDIHIINWLKSRQQGITTVSLAIDVFWVAMHDNLIGCIVCDTDQNKIANRSLLEHYIRSFPDNYFGNGFKVITANRDQIKFSNGSRLDLLVAGTKKKGVAWAEGRGYTLIHCTEIAKYGEPEGVKSLLEGFAQKHPHRLLIFESTANGYNHWRDRWFNGLRQIHTERSGFSGWWSVDNNRIARSNPLYLKFNYDPVPEEREKIRAVKEQYGWTITKEQLAWMRWKEDNAGAEQDLLQQNNPWTAEEAFVQSGRSFFNVRMVNKQLQELVSTTQRVGANPALNPYVYKGYCYIAGDEFYTFTLEELANSAENRELVELKVWEEPVKHGRYVIGFDPAYGRTEHSDAHAIEVFRCYADRLVQVAEYRTSDVDLRLASWVFFHLVAAYGDVMGNIDMQGGPGRQVMREFDHLRQLLASDMHQKKTEERKWTDAAANARWYLDHRPESLGAGYVYNFETTGKNKVGLMENVKSVHYMGELHIRSRRLLEEMIVVTRNGDDIAAPESAADDCKDDRVFATALATRAWTDWIRREMIANNQTYEAVTAAENSPTPEAARRINTIVARFLTRQAAIANQEPERGPKWLIDSGLI